MKGWHFESYRHYLAAKYGYAGRRYDSKMWRNEIRRRVKIVAIDKNAPIKEKDVVHFLEKNPEFVNDLAEDKIKIVVASPNLDMSDYQGDDKIEAEYNPYRGRIRLAAGLPKRDLPRVLKHEHRHVQQFLINPDVMFATA